MRLAVQQQIKNNNSGLRSSGNHFDIQDCIKKIATGDSLAFSKLYKSYLSHIQKQVWKYSKDLLALDDLVQEVFVRLWQKRQHLCSVENFDAWICKFTRNVVLNFLKKQRREQISWSQYCEDCRQFYPPLSDHGDSLQFENVYEHILSQLPLRQRQTFILVKERKLKRQEAATLLKISDHTVKHNLKNAMQKLKILHAQLDVDNFHPQ